MIRLTDISKSYADQVLFDKLDFRLHAGQRVGLVGRNGSGKSTLFKLILGEETADSGEIIIPKGYRVGALRQHLKFDAPTLREEAALALPETSKYDVYRVEKVLFGLGFVQEDLEKSPHSFSGGYQIRIDLAKLLVREPDLLLLDEPTNYLDILSLRWLKSFLRAFEGEVILITHDREFMDAVTTHTMGIVRRSLELVTGDTHKFYAQLKSDDERHEKQKAAQEKKRKELEEFIARNKARASTAALAQSKVKQLEKMQMLDDLGFDPTLRFDFDFKATPAKVLLEVKGLSLGYTPQRLLFDDISFTLDTGECLGIIGKNGTGKSTLLNAIAGELTPTSGEVSLHNATATAHFGQTNIERLSPDLTIMDEVYAANPTLSESRVRSICGSMMFSGDRVEKRISLLSGGERSRVMLAKILARPANLLFLDEPTHHLDMDAIEALTNAITAFNGSVILVSHSEALLKRAADRLIVFTDEGATYFDGGYERFLEKIGWDVEDEELKGTKVDKAASTSNVTKKELKKLRAVLIQERNKLTSPLKKEVERLEDAIMQTEEQIASHHEELITASNRSDSSEVMRLSRLVGEEEEEVESMFTLFENAQNELDDILEAYETKLADLEN